LSENDDPKFYAVNYK
jgi:hypothetical protein